MKNSSFPNVRLVRCPRCREVLPEPADVPFYKCGGCDTILQAKHYNKANERRSSEGSNFVQNNTVNYSVQGGEDRISSPSLSTDTNEGNIQSNAEHGNYDQSGTSNSSREASLSEPKQQPQSSSAQHFREQNQESEQNFEVINTFRKDSSLNESSSPNHEVPSTLVPETGEIKGEIEQHGNCTASSSNESVEQLVLLVSENRETRQDGMPTEDQLEAAHSHIEVASSEATIVRTDGEVDKLNQNVSLNCRLDQPGIAPLLSEVLLSNHPSRHEMDYSSQVAMEEERVEESSSTMKEQLKVSDFSSELLSNEPRVGRQELFSQLGSPSKDMMTTEQRFLSNSREGQPMSEVNHEYEVPFTDEKVSSSQFLTANIEGQGDDMVSRDPDVYSNTEISSTKSTFLETEGLSQLVTDRQSMDERSFQNELGVSNESAIVLPEAEKVSFSSVKLESVEVDDSPTNGNNSVPVLKPVKEAEFQSEVDRSQKTMGTSLTENVKDKKVTETDVRFEAGNSYKDLHKWATRSSAYDGSVSSYDGNDDVKTETFAPEDPRQYRHGRSKTSSESAFERKLDTLQLVEERNPPVMLTEIKMPEAQSGAPYRRYGTRPMSQEFPPRAPLYRRSPERRRYASSGHLTHKDYYHQPIYHPPYQYRDVESRFSRQSDEDGRMISEAVWMGEEFLAYPNGESSSEIHLYPRGRMRYHGTRRSEYHPPVHSIARVPYSGEMVSSGYMRWPSHLPPPGVSYGRGLYGPRDPFDSYAASPQIFSDSDYYSEDQRHRIQRRRRNSQHFQPIGGAAPFITCYHCLELLQLPSDFLVFKGIKVHKVKCSACSKTLKFTLEKGCHLVRHVPKQPAAAGADQLLKSASISQANHDYDGIHTRSASGQVSLRSSSQALERPRHFEDKGKSVMEERHRLSSNAPGGSSPDIPRSAKVTWKLPDRRSTSPLHRLMGYSSPSAVLYGNGSDELETQDYSREGNDLV